MEMGELRYNGKLYSPMRKAKILASRECEARGCYKVDTIFLSLFLYFTISFHMHTH